MVIAMSALVFAALNVLADTDDGTGLPGLDGSLLAAAGRLRYLFERSRCSARGCSIALACGVDVAGQNSAS